MKIVMNNNEMDELMKEANGQGGFQSLLRGLQDKLDRNSGQITLSDEDRERIKRYAFDYGNGGWESRLTTMFGRHFGVDLNKI